MASKRKTIVVDLLRHGEPEGGELLRGRVDHVLTERGWQQMRQALTRTDGLAGSGEAGWTEVISSPLQRCRAFAEFVAEERRLPLKVEAGWQEIDYGDWDGLPLKEWRQKSAEQFREFRQDMAKLAPPNGEDFVRFKDRVLVAWEALAQLPGDSHVLLVTHGGVLRVVLPTVLGMPLNRSQPLQIPFASCSRVKLEIEESGTRASLVFHDGVG